MKKAVFLASMITSLFSLPLLANESGDKLRATILTSTSDCSENFYIIKTEVFSHKQIDQQTVEIKALQPELPKITFNQSVILKWDDAAGGYVAKFDEFYGNKLLGGVLIRQEYLLYGDSQHDMLLKYRNVATFKGALGKLQSLAFKTKSPCEGSILYQLDLVD